MFLLPAAIGTFLTRQPAVRMRRAWNRFRRRRLVLRRQNGQTGRSSAGKKATREASGRSKTGRRADRHGRQPCRRFGQKRRQRRRRPCRQDEGDLRRSGRHRPRIRRRPRGRVHRDGSNDRREHPAAATARAGREATCRAGRRNQNARVRGPDRFADRVCRIAAPSTTSSNAASANGNAKARLARWS